MLPSQTSKRRKKRKVDGAGWPNNEVPYEYNRRYPAYSGESIQTAVEITVLEAPVYSPCIITRCSEDEGDTEGSHVVVGEVHVYSVRASEILRPSQAFIQ